MKKIIAFVLCFILLSGIFISTDVEAADFTEDSIVFDVEYTNWLSDDLTGDDYYDLYRLVIPSTGTVSINGYSENNFVVLIYKGDECLMNKCSIGKSISQNIKLEKGEYLVYINDGGIAGSGFFPMEQTYHMTFSYNFDTSTDAKIKSNEKGKVKITAPKGDTINGYEVRYKKSGSKKWITETIETTKSLNKVFEDLISGKKYTFQVRKYVIDDYGWTYYSNWTQQQKVKIK